MAAEHLEEGRGEEKVDQQFLEVIVEAVEVIHQVAGFERTPGAARQTVASQSGNTDEKMRPDGDLQRELRGGQDQGGPAEANRVGLVLQKGIQRLRHARDVQLFAEGPGQSGF